MPFVTRRDFLHAAALVPALRFPIATGTDDRWRTFELTTRIEIASPRGMTRAWVPVPLTVATQYQEPIRNDFTADGGAARLLEDPTRGFGMVAAEWPEGATPILTVTSRVRTRDVAADLSARSGARLDPAALKRFTAPSRLVPSDGIVRDAATKITRGAATDVDKARAIYDWIVENTYRDPKTRGCGLGDIRFMLESGDLGGKCADLNALYVGLAHAAGLPARDAYGIRLAPSDLGYRSLGLTTTDASKAQHCRAEVFAAGIGWIPVDPADVRKVMLEEPPGNRSVDDDMVRRARQRLFGSWEMNWLAFNFEHDVVLPGSSGPALPFFMYPQAETGGVRFDSLDPAAFRYSISAKDVTAV